MKHLIQKIATNNMYIVPLWFLYLQPEWRPVMFVARIRIIGIWNSSINIFSPQIASNLFDTQAL